MTRDATWALVTNGERALILRGIGDGGADEPIELLAAAGAGKPGDYWTDRAGRSFASGDEARRSAMEPGSDPVLRRMHDFARETLDALGKHHRDGGFTRLAVFAAPKMLGALRQEMPAALRAVLVAETDANLVHLPEADLRRAIREAIEHQPS